MEFFIALRYLRGKRRRGRISLVPLFVALAVFVGTLVLIIALSVANGFEKEVRDRIVGTLAHGKLHMYHGQKITAVDSMVTVVESHSDILAAAPFIEGKGGVEFDKINEGVLIMGVDAKREVKVTELGQKMIAGAYTLDSAVSGRGRTHPGIIVGTGLADKLGVRPKHELVLMTLAVNADAFEPAPRYGRFTVTGIFETGFYEYDANLVYISIPAAQDLLGMKGVDGIQFKTNNLFDAGRIARDLQKHVGGYPYWANDWRSQNKSLFEWMKLEKFIIFVVISLIMIVASFNIVSSLLMTVIEKRREIGILMGLGATSGAIKRIFMLSGTVMGLAGSIAGTGLGVLLCWVQFRWRFIPLPGDIYFIDAVPVLILPFDVMMVFVSANAICWLATLYPAHKASSILPAESIRYE